MTTKLTYWERSPQESSQSAGDCTLDRYQKENPCEQELSLRHPSTLRYLQQSLTWHGVSSQASHTLNRLTSTAPHKLILLSKPKLQTKILTQHSQRLIQPNLTTGNGVISKKRTRKGVTRCYGVTGVTVTPVTP